MVNWIVLEKRLSSNELFLIISILHYLRSQNELSEIKGKKMDDLFEEEVKKEKYFSFKKIIFPLVHVMQFLSVLLLNFIF